MLKKNYGAALAVAMCCVAGAVQAETDEIIITASPISGDKVAIPVTSLTKDQLDAKGGDSLGEMLEGELGLTQSSFATGASRPIIRGLDNFRVRIQENGVSDQGVSALSEDHGAPIDPLSADKIEVLRGPAVLRYGSQAIGGVVTVLNEHIPTRLQEETLSAEAYGSLSSVDNGRSAALALKGNVEGIAINAHGFVRRTDDYELPDSSGDQQDTFLRSDGFTIGASHITEHGYIGVSGGRFNSEYGIPASGGIFIDMEQDRVRLSGSHNNLSFEAGWSDYKHDEVDSATGTIGSTFENEEWESRAEYLFTWRDNSNAAIGIQGGGRDISASGEGGELLAPVDSDNVALFGFDETPINDRVALQTGLRVEHVSHEGTGAIPDQLDQANAAVPENIDAFEVERDRSFTLVSGSAALVYTPDAERLFSLNLSYAERAPAPSELFSKGPHEATETFEIGDPNMGKEKALSAEAHFELNQTDRQVAINLFYTAFDDFINKSATGFTCDDDFDSCGAGTELEQVVFAQEDARFYGVEAAVTQWLGEMHGLQIGGQASFDLVRGKLDQGGNVPRVTPIRLGGGLIAEGDTISAKLNLTHTFTQNRVAVNETRTKGYNNLSAQIAYRPRSHDNLTIGLSGENLTDDEGRNHVSFKKANVVLPGRNFRLYVRAAI